LAPGKIKTEQIERYKRKARELYGTAVVEESERKVRKMSREEWKAVGAEGGAVASALADVVDQDIASEEVQALIAQHHAWIEHFYPCSAERYRGLARLYVEHPEFRAFYDKYSPGLADFMSKAMNHYADGVLAEREDA
jgi:hypothetical protein